MKKKALNVLMAVGIFAAAASMFVSCKDNMGDDMDEARAEIRYLNDLLDYQVNALNLDLQALRDQQKLCKDSCQARMGRLQDQINNLKDKDKKLDELIKAVDEKRQSDSIKYAGEIKKLNDSIKNLRTDIQTIQKNIITINSKISGLQTQDSLFRIEIHRVDSILKVYDIRITNNKNAIDTLKNNVDSLINWYTRLDTTLTNVEAVAKAADSLSKANKDSIDKFGPIIYNINNNVTNIWSHIGNLRDSVIHAYTQADAALGLAQRDSARIDDLRDKFAGYYTKEYLDSILGVREQEIKSAKSVAEKADSLADVANRLAGTADSIAKAAADSAENNKILIQNIEKSYLQADEELQDSIDALAKGLDSLNKEVTKIWKEISLIESNLAKMITSIVMQAVSNPVTGTLITPFGFNTNILCAFYGTNVNGTVDFPVDAIGAEAYNLIGCSESFVINSGETLVDDMDNGVANAGKIYATINPNTVNFEGEQLVLETSAGNPAEVELTPLVKSDKELKFGYTRADNGFYEADATISYDKIQDAKITKNLNLGELKEIAKSALNELKTKGQGNFNVSDTYVKIMNAVSEVIPAYALKATWTEDTTNIKHSIYSKYEIAATALKPLSYEFLAGDWNAPKIPSINYEQLGIKFKLQEAEGVHFNSNTPIYLVYDADGKIVSVHGGWVYGNKVADNEHAKQDAIAEAAAIGGTWVERNLKNLMDIYDELLLDKVITDAYVYNINYLEEQMSKQVEDNIKRILNKVNKVIGKINARIANANYYLQPNVLVKGGDDWYRASQMLTMPTFAGGTGWIMLMPSSNTAELVCPAFKKFVAVTDVVKDDFSASAKGGDATCKSILESANNPMFGMNKVYAGKDPVAFNATETGYIYEVTYASIDYSGYTRTEKVYIRVK